MNQSGIFVPYKESLEEQKSFTMKEIVVIHFLSIYDRCASMVSFHSSIHQIRVAKLLIVLTVEYLIMSYDPPGGQCLGPVW
jgi:hypothetical protein